MRALPEVIVAALFLVGLSAALHLCTACSSPGAAAAESAYTAELLRCVDVATTLAESRACRQAVNLRWGIAETARDGGR